MDKKPVKRNYGNDAAFWGKRAEEFDALQANHRTLRADRDYRLGSGEPGRWRLAGAGPRGPIEFEIVARRAAVAFAETDMDPITAWLEFVMRESGNFEHGSVGVEQDADGKEGASHLPGTIRRVCEASADCCRRLEARALEAAKGSAQSEEVIASEVQQPPTESVGRQIDRLRGECRLTVEQLAERMKFNPRTIHRHISDEDTPLARNLAGYERVFSRLLNRRVVI